MRDESGVPVAVRLLDAGDFQEYDSSNRKVTPPDARPLFTPEETAKVLELVKQAEAEQKDARWTVDVLSQTPESVSIRPAALKEIHQRPQKWHGSRTFRGSWHNRKVYERLFQRHAACDGTPSRFA